MGLDVLLRFLLGLLLGACLWAIGNRAQAESIPATATTQTQPATQTTVVKYSTTSSQSTYGWHTTADDCLPALAAPSDECHVPPPSNPMCPKCAQNGFGGPAKIQPRALSACCTERKDWSG
jgi:hypothetical protein